MGHLLNLGCGLRLPCSWLHGLTPTKRIGGALSSPKCGLDTINHAAGQTLRPLVHRLVRYPDSLGGCCDGAAQLLDCFGLVHSNH